MSKSTQITVLEPAIRTATVISPDIASADFDNMLLSVLVTADAGTPTLNIAVEFWDRASGTWIELTALPEITGAGLTLMNIGQNIVTVAVVAENTVLPARLRLNCVIGGSTPSFTFSVGAILG